MPGPRVVIIGSGFGGLYAAKALADEPVEITILDRRNYHLFQPLLYQVATAALNPADIATPIRSILRHQKNINVILGEATAVDTKNRIVKMTDGEIAFDYLIVATGATHSYFGHPEWERAAPGLKTIEDALEIRRRRRRGSHSSSWAEDRREWSSPARCRRSRGTRCSAIFGASTRATPASSSST